MTRLVRFIAILFAGCSVTCGADMRARLPLAGFFRPGHYLPIEINVINRGVMAIDVAGAVPTRFTATNTGPQIVPLLSLAGALGPVRIDGSVVIDANNLRPLDSHDSLVAVAGGAEAERLGRSLFPGSSVKLIHLNRADPLPGPAAAWQTLDALVLEDRWPGGLKLDDLPTLLAGGTAVAIVASAAPNDRLPWRPVSGGWVLRANLAGPLGCDGNADAYTPSTGWHPDLASTDRLKIVLVAIGAAALLCIFHVRLKRTAATGLTVLTVCIAVLIVGRANDSFEASGNIIVTRSGWTQRDRWEYRAGSIGRLRTESLDGMSWPIFIDPAQTASIDGHLDVTGSELRFDFKLPMDHRLAFLRRDLRPSTDEDVRSTPGPIETQSPMSRLAAVLYKDAGNAHGSNPALNQTDSPITGWGSVTVGH